MQPKCRAELDAARAAEGRKPLTDAQAQAIEDRIKAQQRMLWDTDPAYRGMSADQRMLLAAQKAAEEVQAMAARKVALAEMQALKTAETDVRLQQQRARGEPDRAHALVADMQLVDTRAKAIRNEALSMMRDTITAADSKNGAGAWDVFKMIVLDAENPAMTRDLAIEVFGQADGRSGNALARTGAKGWLDAIEAMRQRFNAAGGDVGKLWYGYLPQPHDAVRILKAGADRWAERLLPKLDRNRYLKEDGTRMSDAEVLDVLRAAHRTIITDGADDVAPGAFRNEGSRANRGSQSRAIHFKDGESYLQYMAEFGSGSMYDAMTNHLGGMARSIALLEHYGPNPSAQMRLQFDLAARGVNTTVDALPRVFGMRPQAYWSVLNGISGTPVHAPTAQVGQFIRNVQTASKLGGAVISSITDIGTLAVTTGYNLGMKGQLDLLRTLYQRVAPGGKELAEWANMHGLMAESAASTLNRFAGEHVVGGWSGRMANATMRLSLMNAWTDWLRQSFSLTMMAGMTRMSRVEWGKLDAADRARLERHGFTEADWAVLKQAQPDSLRGVEMVTPEAIRATGAENAAQLVTKYLAYIIDESEFAVVNPDLTARTLTSLGGTQAGTFRGEVARSVMQFKSFPFAVMSRHWRRAFEQQGAANRLAYASALFVSTTALGALAFQLKEISNGRDPISMERPDFWLRAVAQGGGLGFLGDVLLRDSTSDLSPQQGLFELLGPTAGSIAQLYELTKGNLDEAAAGKDTRAGAEAIRFIKGHVPLGNLWYAKTAMDQAVLHDLQEWASPGYLSRMQQRSRKQWGNDYFWQPGGQFAPERAPSFSDIAGQQ